jgi:hypothetical protein
MSYLYKDHIKNALTKTKNPPQKITKIPNPKNTKMAPKKIHKNPSNNTKKTPNITKGP